jgi:hypothetical protein
MQRIVKQITKAVPRHPLEICGALKERLEHLERALFGGSYHITRMLELVEEMQESITLDQLLRSAKELNLSVPTVPEVVPTSGGNPTPLYFSDFAAWPEAEELSPAERQEIRRCGDEIV